MRHNQHNEDVDIDVQACSMMDCTGLIPALPQSELEQEAYEDLYPYTTRATSTDDSPKIRQSESFCPPAIHVGQAEAFSM